MGALDDLLQPVPQQPEQLLARALYSSSTSAAPLLFDLYGSRIFTYTTSLVGDQKRASALTHDTFRLSLDNGNHLRDPEQIRAWVYAIARVESIRALRVQARAGDDDATLNALDGGTTPAHGLTPSDAELLVHQALPGLATSDREVLELTKRHGFSIGDVAAITGVSAGEAQARSTGAMAGMHTAVGAVLQHPAQAVSCPTLQALILSTPSSGIGSKQTSRHTNSCPLCLANAKRTDGAIAMVSWPLLSAPAGVRAALIDPQGNHVPSRFAISDGNLRFSRSGWPETPNAKGSPIPVLPPAGTAAFAPGAAGVAVADTAGNLNDTQVIPAISPTSVLQPPPIRAAREALPPPPPPPPPPHQPDTASASQSNSKKGSGTGVKVFAAACIGAAIGVGGFAVLNPFADEPAKVRRQTANFAPEPTYSPDAGNQGWYIPQQTTPTPTTPAAGDPYAAPSQHYYDPYTYTQKPSASAEPTYTPPTSQPTRVPGQATPDPILPSDPEPSLDPVTPSSAPDPITASPTAPSVPAATSTAPPAASPNSSESGTP